MKVILGLIGLSFVIGFGMLTGYGGQTASDGAIAAFVNDKPITNRDLAITYTHMLSNYRDRLGDQLTDDVLQRLNLRFQALNVLINRIVLVETAKDMGFRVGDAELRDAIAGVAAFHDANGNFDPERYRTILRSQRPPMTPVEFETQQRQQLLLDKLEAFVKSQIHLFEADILREWLLDNQRIDLEYVRFEPRVFQPRVHIDDTELREYYEQRRDDFIAGERVTLEMVRLNSAALAGAIVVDDAEVEQRFTANPDRYRADAQVKASHILVKLASDASASDIQKTQQKAQELLDLINTGSTFSEVALAHSDDPGSKAKGGDLGWFGKGQMVAPFEEAAFATPAGAITGPVRTQFGFHIINVLERRDAGAQPLDAVRGQIVDEIRQERAAAEVTRLVQELTAGESLEQAATAAGLSVDVVTLDEQDRTNALRYPPDLIAAVFGKTANLDARPRAFGGRAGATVVARLTDRTAAAPKPFEAVRDEIRARLINDRAITLAAEAAADALAQMRQGTGLKRIADRWGLETITTGMFSARSGEIPQLGRQPEVLRAALALTTAQPIPRNAFRVGDDYVVMRLVDRNDPTPEAYRAGRETVARELLTKRRDEIWQEFMRNARNQARINLENPPADLFPQGAPQS